MLTKSTLIPFIGVNCFGHQSKTVNWVPQILLLTPVHKQVTISEKCDYLAKTDITHMIRSFKHKGLEKLYEKGSQEGINPDHAKRVRAILARLDASLRPQDMNLPGLKFHPLKGIYKEFWSVSVSGNWRIIFRFEGNHAYDVDYIDYH